MSAIICFLIGAQIIFLFVMTSFGRWYIGGPLAILFWIVSFLVLNRKDEAHGYQQQLNDDDEPVYQVHHGIGDKAKLSFVHYFRTIYRGLSDRLAFSFIMIALIIVMALVISLTTCNVCVTYSPIEFSTSFTRRVFGQGKICEYNTICYSYLTVPEDMSTSMIVNYQYYGFTPQTSYVEIYTSFEALAQKHEATCFRMNNIVDEERYQCWADITGLQPGFTYYYKPIVKISDQEFISVQASRKFRTGPSLNSTEEIMFTTGGDMEWSESGLALAAKAAASSPLFSMVGGDIAYANGDPHCFRRWDMWFTHWQTSMVTPDNYTIPILTCIGNHEAGNFKMPKWRNGFYLRYFPHQIGLQNIDPQDRPLTHFHRFASHSVLLTMDSWVHLTPAEQAPWLNQTLSRFSSLRNKFALYHISMYSPKVYMDAIDYGIIESINQEWKPSFDHYGLTIAFENHFHCYKATHPVRYDKVVDEFKGTRYLGDGAWGQRSRENTVWSTNPLIKHTKNYAHVFIVQATSNVTSATSYYFDIESKSVRVLDSDLKA